MSEIIVTASEANRSFSKLLRMVRNGTRIRITSHGEIAAVLAPPEVPSAEEDAHHREAVTAWMERLEAQPIAKIDPWTRDELYERESWKNWEQ